MHGSTPAPHFGGSDHRFGLPVAALGEHLRPGCKYQRERRVLVEPRHEMDGFKRRHDRHAVGERVNGRSSPLPRRFADASLLTATRSVAPRALASAK